MFQYKFLAKRVERLKYRWEDNIKIVLRRIVGEDVNWTGITQDRVKWGE
jgi:hypothetical protein